MQFGLLLFHQLLHFAIKLDGIFIGASQTKEIRNAMMVSVASFIIISIYLTKYFQ